MSEDNKQVINEELKAIFGNETLSEDFQKNLSELFDKTVNAKVESALAEAKAAAKEEDEKEKAEKEEKIKDDCMKEMAENVGQFLDYMADEWMTKNQLAIEHGLRTEIAENFINKMVNVFKENYVDLPEEKYDLVASMQESISGLEKKLNEQLEKNIEQSKVIKEQKKAAVFAKVTKDLADTTVEKLKGLSEGIDYEDDEKYLEKLTVIKESFIPAKTASEIISEDTKHKLDTDNLNEEVVIKDENSADVMSAFDRINRKN